MDFYLCNENHQGYYEIFKKQGQISTEISREVNHVFVGKMARFSHNSPIEHRTLRRRSAPRGVSHDLLLEGAYQAAEPLWTTLPSISPRQDELLSGGVHRGWLSGSYFPFFCQETKNMKSEVRKAYEKRWREENRERVNQSAREYYAKNIETKKEKNQLYRLSHRQEEKDRQRKNHLRRKYGITEIDYLALLVDQDYQCKICGSKTPGGRGKYFHVDHHHDDGDIRGLLCSRCNHVIGLIEENVDIALGIINYIDPPP
jgi:hypothetical protein